MRTLKKIPVRRAASGLTLIELLMVVTILSVIMAIAAPMIGGMMKDRKLREAARAINTFIMVAKARATEIGRPAGIMVMRDNDNQLPNASYQIFLCETPPPFSGDTLDVRVRIDSVASGTATATFLPPQSLFSIDPTFAKQGDLIQFDYKGPKYFINSITDSTVVFSPPFGTNAPLPIVNSAGVPFQIYRQPVPASGDPLELPIGIVVDLEFSGVGLVGREMALPANVTTGKEFSITFLPTGGVDLVYGFGPTGLPPSGTIHFLVGRVEQISKLLDGSKPPNVLDPTALWVSIGHMNGNAITTENTIYDPATWNAANLSTFDGMNPVSVRKAAQDRQAMGGR